MTPLSDAMARSGDSRRRPRAPYRPVVIVGSTTIERLPACDSRARRRSAGASPSRARCRRAPSLVGVDGGQPDTAFATVRCGCRLPGGLVAGERDRCGSHSARALSPRTGPGRDRASDPAGAVPLRRRRPRSDERAARMRRERLARRRHRRVASRPAGGQPRWGLRRRSDRRRLDPGSCRVEPPRASVSALASSRRRPRPADDRRSGAVETRVVGHAPRTTAPLPCWRRRGSRSCRARPRFDARGVAVDASRSRQRCLAHHRRRHSPPTSSRAATTWLRKRCACSQTT